MDSYNGAEEFIVWSLGLPSLGLRIYISSGLLLVLQAALLGQTDTRANPEVGSSRPTNPSISPQEDAIATAKSLAESGKLNEAEEIVRAYLSAHQSSGNAHFLLGYILFRRIQAKASLEGRVDQPFQEAHAKAALAEYTEGARYEQPSAFDLKIVALNYVLLGAYADADKWLTKSIEANPKDLDSWYYLGRAKYNEQRFEEAGSAFKQCLRLDPKNVRAEDNLGLVYAALNRHDEAISAYQKAISWQAQSLVKDSGPFIDLGTLLLDDDRAADAVPYLSEGVAISPQESRAHAALGKAYSRISDLTNAQRELEKAVELAPDNASLHYVLGQLYRKLGLMDKARIELARTAELNGSHSSPITDWPAENGPK
jgi:tetratricopeptide (TPR) repeat protein